jgi:AmpD protein
MPDILSSEMTDPICKWLVNGPSDAMKIIDGKLNLAKQHTTQNCDDRPGCSADLIVVHCISLPAGHFGGDFVTQLFCDQLDLSRHADFSTLKDMHVSSHVFIRRDGAVLQFVPFHKRAWHAGKSEFEGQQNCNDFSIGIELEGTDISQFSEVQYEKLSGICKLLMDGHSIPPERIVGHSDIAPGRKTDPGVCFDWHKLHSLMGEK